MLELYEAGSAKTPTVQRVDIVKSLTAEATALHSILRNSTPSTPRKRTLHTLSALHTLRNAISLS